MVPRPTQPFTHMLRPDIASAAITPVEQLPPTNDDMAAALAFYSRVSVQETKVLAIRGIDNVEDVTITRVTSGDYPEFQIDVKGHRYFITYALDFANSRMRVTHIGNNSDQRRIGRRLAGNAFVVAAAHGMQMATLYASSMSGAHFWAGLGLYVTPVELKYFRELIAPRVAALKKYSAHCDYPQILALSALKDRQDLSKLARMRGTILFDVQEFNDLLKSNPVSAMYSTWQYTQARIIGEKIVGGTAVPVMTPGQFIFLGQHFTGYAMLTDKGQMRRIQHFTSVPQSVVIPPTPRAGYSLTPAGRTAHPR